jgi:hypothetical protein
MLAEFRDYLKTLNVADHYYIGKLDNSKEKALGLYSMGNLAPVEAVGKDSSYDIAGVRILLHWNKNAKESEKASRNLYSEIRYIQDQAMGDEHVFCFMPDDNEPTFIGTDDNNVYEYHIAGRLYYKRG